MNIDRLHRYQANPEYRATRTVESLGLVYETHYPGRSMRTARGAKVSPVHHRLVAQRAYFKDVSGWEGADWYARKAPSPRPGSCPGGGRTGSATGRPSTTPRAPA
jgi:4-methylaminobutanoate oxidase (formaldehyde-forming)